MNRLQKKCFVGSAGLHGLLLLVLFVGPAFFSPSTSPDNMPVLDFVAYKTVDEMMSGGGNPNAKPPPLAPQPIVQPPPPKPAVPEQKPAPEPEPVVKPDPKPEPDSFETEKQPRKPQVSTTLVNRKTARTAEDKKKAEREAREAAEARKRLASQIGAVAERLSDSLSSGTEVELKGPGGGGIPYANFLQAVKSRYASAWLVPDGVTDDSATTTATVTIARDGTVVNARITRHSGNLEVDRSVQRTLDEVKWAAPLPDNAKEDQRTVTINFNVKARRAIG